VALRSYRRVGGPGARRLASRSVGRRYVFPLVGGRGPCRRPIRREALAQCDRRDRWRIAVAPRRSRWRSARDGLRLRLRHRHRRLRRGLTTGQKRLTSRRTFRHSAMRRPYSLFQIRSTALRYDASSTVLSSMTDSRSSASALGTFQGFGQPAHDHAMGRRYVSRDDQLRRDRVAERPRRLPLRSN
jgi:hypothetical protein